MKRREFIQAAVGCALVRPPSLGYDSPQRAVALGLMAAFCSGSTLDAGTGEGHALAGLLGNGRVSSIHTIDTDPRAVANGYRVARCWPGYKGPPVHAEGDVFDLIGTWESVLWDVSFLTDIEMVRRAARLASVQLVTSMMGWGQGTWPEVPGFEVDRSQRAVDWSRPSTVVVYRRLA